MKTALLYKQHERCLKALELIATCDEYIKRCRENLKNKLYPSAYTNGYNERNIKKYTRIKERLVLYYSNQFMKMVEPVAEAME